MAIRASLVELAVRKRRVLGDQGGFVRVFSRVLLKELVQQGDVRLLGRFGLETVEHLLLLFRQRERVADGFDVIAEQL